MKNLNENIMNTLPDFCGEIAAVVRSSLADGSLVRG